MKHILLVLNVVLFASCSTIFKGTSQSITFSSEPPGAEVLVDGISMGQTPVTIKLKKNKYDSLMLKKSGYVAATRPLDKSYDPLTLLNVFWDLSTTDLVSGAAFEYEPNQYHFTLIKESTPK